MRAELTFAGVPLSDFGVYISGDGTFNAPARAYDTVEIPGRDGALLLSDKRLENIDITYPAFVYANFRENMRQLRSFLLSRVGYQRLSDTYHPDEYRLAYFPGELEVNATPVNDAGSFDLTFTCKPQRWLTSGETVQTFTDDGTITNPTYCNALPLIRVYGVGTLEIGDYTLSITSADGYTDIDCDIMEAYKGNENRNSVLIISDFPVLVPGDNEISFTGFTQVEITPRWWVL